MVSKGLTGVGRAGYSGRKAVLPASPAARSVIASEAKRSIGPQRKYGLLRCARNDGARAHLHLPAARFARVLQIVSPKQEGAGNAGCRLAPTVSCARVEIQPEHSGIPRAMVLRLMARSPWRRIRLASIVGELTVCIARSGFANLRRLDASHGRQNHTLLPYASAPFVCRAADRSQAKARPAIPQRSGRCRVHRIPTHVRDDRDTPLLAGRNGLTCRGDLGAERRSIFLRRGLDGANHADRIGEISLVAHRLARSARSRSSSTAKTL
jgi:hypothetical protein